MAYQHGMRCVTLTAGGTIAQYKFVKLSADNTVIQCDGVTDKPIGVAQAAASSGDAVEVCYEGITKVQGDADLTAGGSVGTSADGQAATYTVSDTTKYIVGQVVLGNSAAAGLASVLISCANVRVLA